MKQRSRLWTGPWHTPIWVLALLLAVGVIGMVFTPIAIGWGKFLMSWLSIASLVIFTQLLMQRRKSVQRRWRIENGLCAECAYPVGESPVCTECGEPVKHGAAERPST